MANPTQMQSPFWSPTIGGTSFLNLPPGDPASYRAPIEARNDLVSKLYGQLPSDAGGAYSQSPGLPRANQTLMALMQMAGRGSNTSFGPSSQANLGQDVAQLGPGVKRGLALQEPDRLSKLMDLLTNIYQWGGQTSAQAIGDTAKLQLLIAQHKQAKAQAYGQVPIIGPILAASQ